MYKCHVLFSYIKQNNLFFALQVELTKTFKNVSSLGNSTNHTHESEKYPLVSVLAHTNTPTHTLIRAQAAGEVKLTNPTADKHNSPFLRIYRLTAVTGSIYKCGFSPQKEGL